MELALRFHVLEHAPQRGWCRKGRVGPERHFAQRLHPQHCRSRPAASSRSQLRVVRVVGSPSSPCCGASACRLRPLLVPSLTFCSPGASGSLLLLCYFGFGFFWYLRAPPPSSASQFLYYLPFAPLCGYCPFLLAFISAPRLCMIPRLDSRTAPQHSLNRQPPSRS